MGMQLCGNLVHVRINDRASFSELQRGGILAHDVVACLSEMFLGRISFSFDGGYLISHIIELVVQFQLALILAGDACCLCPAGTVQGCNSDLEPVNGRGHRCGIGSFTHSCTASGRW